jgi:hypothetical protein
MNIKLILTLSLCISASMSFAQNSRRTNSVVSNQVSLSALSPGLFKMLSKESEKLSRVRNFGGATEEKVRQILVNILSNVSDVDVLQWTFQDFPKLKVATEQALLQNCYGCENDLVTTEDDPQAVIRLEKEEQARGEILTTEDGWVNGQVKILNPQFAKTEDFKVLVGSNAQDIYFTIRYSSPETGQYFIEVLKLKLDNFIQRENDNSFNLNLNPIKPSNWASYLIKTKN